MRFLIAAVIFVFSLFIFFNFSPSFNKILNIAKTPAAARQILSAGADRDYSDVLVTRAVDGDTLLLESGERVRLIGIDTPEVHESQKLYRDSRRTSQDSETIKKLGKLAWAFTRRLVEQKRVRLEFDVEKRDKYKRLLAYVYLKDGTFVNAEIVRSGFASLMTIPPNVKYAGLFSKLYEEAREKKAGLWGDVQ